MNRRRREIDAMPCKCDLKEHWQNDSLAAKREFFPNPRRKGGGHAVLRSLSDLLLGSSMPLEVTAIWASMTGFGDQRPNSETKGLQCGHTRECARSPCQKSGRKKSGSTVFVPVCMPHDDRSCAMLVKTTSSYFDVSIARKNRGHSLKWFLTSSTSRIT